jgi:hypothetical protein
MTDTLRACSQVGALGFLAAVAISDHLERGLSGVIDSDIDAGLVFGTCAAL